MILFITGHIGQKLILLYTWETTGYGREDNNPAYRNNNRHIVLVPSGFKGFELLDHSVLTTDASRFWAAPQN